MSKNIYAEIEELLKDNKINFQVFRHEPVYTSEQAAKVRERIFGIKSSEILKRGAKAMILKSNHDYFQFVISAAEKIDFKKVKNILSKTANLANSDDVFKITDCVPGSVPPFGNLFNVPVYVDKSLLKNEFIDFNAGELTISIIMRLEDWIKIVNPIVEDFCAQS